ncbi:ATP-binding cassette domain-containing protein [Actinomadura kijaniata]|uniref:ATP-binding cassette domain-containing protein n=1 Tax=Actinomadura kijaniata TaxID=46161 RepID=UPI003F1A6C0B
MADTELLPTTHPDDLARPHRRWAAAAAGAAVVGLTGALVQVHGLADLLRHVLADDVSPATARWGVGLLALGTLVRAVAARARSRLAAVGARRAARDLGRRLAGGTPRHGGRGHGERSGAASARLVEEAGRVEPYLHRHLPARLAVVPGMLVVLAAVLPVSPVVGLVLLAAAPPVLLRPSRAGAATAAAVVAAAVWVTLALALSPVPGLPALGLQPGTDPRDGLFALLATPLYFQPSRRFAAASRAADEVRAAADGPGGAVVLDGVTVRHPGGDRPALQGVSLFARPGALTVVAGPPGSGKSTLLAVAAGRVVPGEGHVVPAVRHAWVGRRPHLFPGTLADNVALPVPDAGRGQVVAAMRTAGLYLGPDLRVGEGGVLLSDIDLQRVALARAVLTDAPVLLLDEPTADLDIDAEAEFATALTRLARTRTVLVASHSPVLRAVADHLLELDGGRPRESGRPWVSEAVGFRPSHVATAGRAVLRRVTGALRREFGRN